MPFFFQLKAVPKGRYAASLNVGTTSATGRFVPFCSVADSTSLFAVVSYGQDHGDVDRRLAINSASGIVKLAHKGEVGLVCQDADETFNSEPLEEHPRPDPAPPRGRREGLTVAADAEQPAVRALIA